MTAHPDQLWATDVAISLLVAMAVTEAVQELNGTLASQLMATFPSDSTAGNHAVLYWPLRFAVRAQLALVAAKDPAAELLGRVLDAALGSRAGGTPFKLWATPPLSSCVYEASEPPTASDLRSTSPGAFPVGFEMPTSPSLERDAKFYRVLIR